MPLGVHCKIPAMQDMEVGGGGVGWSGCATDAQDMEVGGVRLVRVCNLWEVKSQCCGRVGHNAASYHEPAKEYIVGFSLGAPVAWDLTYPAAKPLT